MSRKNRIEQILSTKISPSFLSILDESHNHHVPQGAQTHFKVIAVSPLFTDLTRINRHRLVNRLLQDEFQQGLHALSLFLYSPEEWASGNHAVPNSPNCRDGYGA